MSECSCVKAFSTGRTHLFVQERWCDPTSQLKLCSSAPFPVSHQQSTTRNI
uniref:Uncharacterized protein n=1 Tax=Anguilla anguilla TaxID=7936 RepID=A0A0E9WVH3_ANGAN